MAETTGLLNRRTWKQVPRVRIPPSPQNECESVLESECDLHRFLHKNAHNMFDFERLNVYQLILELNTEVLKWLAVRPRFDPYMKDQWRRATISVALNLAEGTGRISKGDKKHFFVIARSSVFECVAIIQTLKSIEELDESQYSFFYQKYESISKMLLGIYRNTK